MGGLYPLGLETWGQRRERRKGVFQKTDLESHAQRCAMLSYGPCVRQRRSERRSDWAGEEREGDSSKEMRCLMNDWLGG